ncbi:MAG: hypothetical protein K9N47_04785 [Prosthecobacter sp.]|uniref:hypothetical protein n=1 Tax=Prosthecobacter sp. TaxID=1965333 RepID=UPI0025F701D2|nr:hypothetical protein [Prosthecobacter sp.]MCF7785414.1 hypothetical protein [Prosthecobacter sp.]
MRKFVILLLTATTISLWSATPQSPTTLKPKAADEEEIPKEAEAAVKALKKFLATTTVEERLRCTRTP